MNKLILLVVTLWVTTAQTATATSLLSFPDAVGWGRFATGGRGGTVYHVTNLNDSGTGSLRDAVSQPNRIVVFDVSGVIRIYSRIVFARNITVAGQTAPGEGVTVYGDGVSFSGADNIIVRYMRFRMGAVGTKDKDCAGVANGRNMIFDHCSFAWGQDENFSINWDNKGSSPRDITLQNCIVGQGLMTHSAGGLMQADNITLYRILMVDNSTRNFKVKGVNQYVNNLVYNWKNAAYNMGGDSEGQSYANIESNLFINGPAVGGDCLTGGNQNFHFYGSDNCQDRNRDGLFNPTEFTGDGGGDRQAAPFDYPALPTVSATTLVDQLLPDVGASLPYRDLADCYMVHEVFSLGTEGRLITNENELPIGVPTAWSWFAGQKPVDTDADGMPDYWETANGTDPAADDAMLTAANGYCNIENYINSISRADRQFFLRAPQLLTLTDATTTTLTLSWADFTDDEDGFIVEVQSSDGQTSSFKTSLPTFTIDDLTPASTYIVRVCAYKADELSAYTPALTVKTLPEQTGLIDVETFSGTGEGEWLINPLDDETITLSEPVQKSAVVVYSDAHVTISGPGCISGPASMNKAGTGLLTIASDQQYEGATVVHDGIYEFATLRNGGQPSGLGQSQEFAQNWAMAGGTYRYTGPSTATNRSARLYDDTAFDIATSGTVVTMNGAVEGQGSLIIDGEGTLSVANNRFFQYDGDLLMRSGTLRLGSKEVSDAGLGSASRLVMAGGRFVTVGKNEASVTYDFPIAVEASTTSTVDFDLWNVNKCRVSGTGTLIWNVHYLREYIEGNWDQFSGHLIVNGTGKANQSQFAVRNGVGVRNAVVTLRGTASIVGGKNASTFYIGGLSGDAGTALSGFNVKKAGEGTWVVGTADTDETFRGTIDDYDQAHSHPGHTSIEKQGRGSWRLTGTLTHTGTTIVTAGTLIVNGRSQGTGAVTVRRGATLAGEGTIAGRVTVNVGGTLHAGDSIVGDRVLTLSGGVTVNQGGIICLPLAADADAVVANHLKIGGTLAVNGGVLSLDLADGLQLPDDAAITLFDLSGANVSGSGFTTIEPARPSATQVWDISQLLTTGRIYVRSACEDTSVAPLSSKEGSRGEASAFDLGGRPAGSLPSLWVQDGRKHLRR